MCRTSVRRIIPKYGSKRSYHAFLATVTVADTGIDALLTATLYKPVYGDAEDHRKT
jgi:hypothetical protein